MALLRLTSVPGLGPRRASALLVRHGSARAVLRAAGRELGADLSGALASEQARALAEAAARAVTSIGARVLPVFAADYPARLRHLPDPPPVLFLRGDERLLSRRTIAIVGTRRATAYGRSAAASLAAGLVEAGAVIVSGLALGIDGAAHAAALGAAGATVAVLGSGIDVPYPRAHRPLFERLARDGLLVSEFGPGTPPKRHHFPRRNRILAALADAVIVVEAPARSGALITVDHALDMGREVLAVPGPIGRATSEGTNRLIQSGAGLVTCAADVIDALEALGGGRAGANRRVAAGRPRPRLAAEEGQLCTPPQPGPGAREQGLDAVRAALAGGPASVDEIAGAMSEPANDVLATLLRLELAGFIRSLPGSRYAWRPAPGR